MRLAVAGLIILISTVSAVGAPPSILVQLDRMVAVAGLDSAAVEPHLSINPKDSNNWIAGAMVANSNQSYHIVALSSHDGGKAWNTQDLGGTEGGDVWTAFLADGTAVISCLSGPQANLQVFRSSDGGRTWVQPAVTVERSQDHPTLLVGPGGTIFTVSSGSAPGSSGKSRSAIIVARSDNGGVSFSEPSRTIANNLSYEAHNPTILADGTLAVPFAEHRRPGSRRRLSLQRDWLLLSTDRGTSFSEPLLISESCDARGGWSSLAAFRDAIYHICVAQDFNGIQFRRTDNGGETWSDPIRIDSPGDVMPQAWAPAIAVNPSGAIAIAWSDARNDRSTIKGNLRCKEIFFTASTDGGRTFAPEVRVSSKASCPGAPRNVDVALRFPAGGEYMGLAPGPGNSFQLLWSDSRSDLFRLYTAMVMIQPQ
jgi:hypothetical protein